MGPRRCRQSEGTPGQDPDHGIPVARCRGGRAGRGTPARIGGKTRERIAAEDAAVQSTLPEARPAEHCVLCPVRGICDSYWASAAPNYLTVPDGKWFDLEAIVGNQNGPRSWWLHDPSGARQILLRTTPTTMFERARACASSVYDVKSTRRAVRRSRSWPRIRRYLRSSRREWISPPQKIIVEQQLCDIVVGWQGNPCGMANWSRGALGSH